MVLIFDRTCQSFFGFGELGVFHWLYACFVFGVVCAYGIFFLRQRVLELALHAETFTIFCCLCLLLVYLQNVGRPLFVIRKERWDCIMSFR